MELTLKKNVKPYPMPVPHKLRQYIPDANLVKNVGILLDKGETVEVPERLGAFLRNQYGYYFLKPRD